MSQAILRSVCEVGPTRVSFACRVGLMPGAKPLQSSAAANGLVLNDSTACTMVQSLAAVLDCIERLMSQSAALPVPVPSTGLLMLCSRILSVDDSLAATGETHFTKPFRKRALFWTGCA